MTTDIAPRPVTELTIEPDQLTFTDAQLAALQQLGIDNAPKGDQMLFFHQAKRTGLDPFAKQIYMIGRNTKVTDYVNGRKVERWVVKYTIQTGIDGYRVTGHRLAEQRGDEIEVEDALWCGEDGTWSDVWLDRKRPPLAAKYTVIKNGKRFSAVAMYDEYVQGSKVDGEFKPNSMWGKMPANQIAKCAEAAAWRKAYPNDFSGLVLEDAAQGITIDADPEPPRKRASTRQGADGVRAALAAKKSSKPEPTESSTPEAEPVEPQPADTASNEGTEPEAPQVELITPAERKRLWAKLTDVGLTKQDECLAWINDVLKLDEADQIKATEAITAAQATELFKELDRAESPA